MKAWNFELTAFGLGLAILLGSALGPACAQSEAFGDHSVTVKGVQRTFVVHIPVGLPRPAPVVLIFHGAGGRPQSIERRTGLDELADQHGFIAVYPAGTDRGSRPGGTWNVGGPNNRSSSDDVAFVRAVLRDVELMSPIDHNRIYAIGFSMGGIFSYRLACEMSETFAAIAPVAATMVEQSCHPNSPVAVLHIHGTDDDRIPIGGGRGEKTAPGRMWPGPQQAVSSWSKLDGCREQPIPSDNGCTTYGQCRAAVEYCAIPGGGHSWPGGASERIWAFFAANPKQAR